MRTSHSDIAFLVAGKVTSKKVHRRFDIVLRFGYTRNMRPPVWIFNTYFQAILTRISLSFRLLHKLENAWRNVVPTELYISVMAGVVISLFLMVSEVALMRKRVSAIRSRLLNLYKSRKFLRLLVEVSAIAAFFLVQPIIVGLLVIMALDNVSPDFSGNVIQQLRQALISLV